MGLHTVYEATIRSLLEYACPVFVGLSPTLSERLNRIVRRAHRIMAHNEDFECHCEDLRTRRDRLALKLFAKAENNKNHILHAFINIASIQVLDHLIWSITEHFSQQRRHPCC